MLFHHEEFFHLFLLLRKTWIRGFLGAGKTLLGVALAEELLRRGYADGVLANIPTVLPATLDDEDDGTLFDRVLLWDETHEDMDSRKSMTNSKTAGSYLRKSNTFLIAPSIYPIDKRQRDIIVWRAANVLSADFCYLYRYKLDLDYITQDGGWFGLWNPSAIHSHFESYAYPSSTFLAEIEKRFLATTSATTPDYAPSAAVTLSDLGEFLNVPPE